MPSLFLVLVYWFLLLNTRAHALQPPYQNPSHTPLEPQVRSSLGTDDDRSNHVLRRSVLLAPIAAVSIASLSPVLALAAGPNGLPLSTAPCGLKWADAKVGTGEPIALGSMASIDYSMASTAGRFPQIYTTKDKGQPYRWTLGDGTTIAGIEKAVVGDEGIPPMQPGGIRRVVVPSNLAYEQLAAPNAKCVEGGKDGAIGPIPPKDGSGSYQRWLQLYCNPRIPYQPDLVLDIKLYGKRTTNVQQ